MVTTAETIEMTRDEILERIEDGAQDRRGVSGAELVRQYRAGYLDDAGEVADLLALADLLGSSYPGFD